MCGNGYESGFFCGFFCPYDRLRSLRSLAMIRKLLPLLGALLVSGYVRAQGDLIREVPIAYNKVGTAITVSVSTSAWTVSNTSTSKVQDRSGFRVTNPTSNSYKVYAVCHASTPSEAITVLINEISPGGNLTMPCGANLNLYLLSLTAAQNVNVWEFGQ
jgi:hypothetical protein